MGFPLAFVALPLYVVLPHHYANSYALPLSWIGALLLATRLGDAFIDPWLGRCTDGWFAQASTRVLAWARACSVLLSGGLVLLFFPHWLTGNSVTIETLLLLMLAALVVSYLSYSFLNIALQTWGARLAGDAQMRSRLVGWREGLGLAGVILASLVPGLLGMEALVSGFAVLLGLSLWAWWYAPRPVALHDAAALPLRQSMLQPWRNAGFRRLLLVFMLNGIASAIPATLMLFFVEDRLQLPQSLQSQFLGAYFLAAAVSMPLWLIWCPTPAFSS
mgnify:CR=1 FL=1